MSYEKRAQTMRWKTVKGNATVTKAGEVLKIAKVRLCGRDKQDLANCS